MRALRWLPLLAAVSLAACGGTGQQLTPGSVANAGASNASLLRAAQSAHSSIPSATRLIVGTWSNNALFFGPDISSTVMPSHTLESGFNTPIAFVQTPSKQLFVVNDPNAEGFGLGPGFIAILDPPYTKVTTTVSDGIHNPGSIAFDQAGDLIVANTLNSTVTVYEKPYTGKPKLTISDGLDYPISVGVDPDGKLIVANFLGNTIDIFTKPYTGKPQVIKTGIDQPTAILVHGRTLLVANQSGGSGGTGDVAIYKSPYTKVYQTVTDQIDRPGSLLMSSSGILFVGNGGGSGIGNVAVFKSPYDAPAAVIKSGIDGPWSMQLDSANNLYVGQGNGGDDVDVYAPPYIAASPAAVVKVIDDKEGAETPSGIFVY
jgi:sugar lactone lactonase YvrE